MIHYKCSLIHLSSLGTKSAQISSQNLGQNGYRKYEDGLLVQWGVVSNSTYDTHTVYLPISFFNASYVVSATAKYWITNDVYISSAMIHTIFTSKFNIVQRHTTSTGAIYGSSGQPVHWIAIGRWK